MRDTWYAETWAWVNPKVKSAGSWLHERVTSKGVWGLGCRVCNFAVKKGKPCANQMRPFVRGVLRTAHCITRQHLVRHSESKFHRGSARHWLGGHLDRGAPSVEDFKEVLEHVTQRRGCAFGGLPRVGRDTNIREVVKCLAVLN